MLVWVSEPVEIPHHPRRRTEHILNQTNEIRKHRMYCQQREAGLISGHQDIQKHYLRSEILSGVFTWSLSPGPRTSSRNPPRPPQFRRCMKSVFCKNTASVLDKGKPIMGGLSGFSLCVKTSEIHQNKECSPSN